MAPAACVTVDLDSLRCYAAIHGLPEDGLDDPGADPIYRVALPRMLALFKRHSLPATLFCVGRDLASPFVADALRDAAQAGHELGNHTQHHRYDLRSLPPATIADEIAAPGEALSALQGRPVAGFRTPGYNLSPVIFQELIRQGYRYDSSLFPCPPYYSAKGAIMALRWLQGQPSRSQLNLLPTLAAPLTPYRAAARAPWRRARSGEAGLVEVPMALVPGLRFPLIGTSLHLLGARGFSALLPLLARTHRELLQLEFHAIDFLDADDPGVPAELAARQPDLRIPWAAKAARWDACFAQVARRWRFATLEAATAALPFS